MDRKLPITDPPSCDFLAFNIAAEREAVEQYMAESRRTDDLVVKKVWHVIADEEMIHLEMLEDISDRLKCK